MFDLTDLTTLKLPFMAKSVIKLSSVENVCVSMQELCSIPRLVVGGGSNLVVLEPKFDGIVLRPEIQYYEVTEIGNDVYLEVGAGHPWHKLVMRTLDAGWFGLENLALIPGWMGAAPIQNIGAYGVELKDHCHRVKLYDFEEQAIIELSACELNFGYRHSVFKENPDRFLVLTVTLRLSKHAAPRVSYGVISEELERRGLDAEKPLDIARAVISIRQSKLPDPDITPNVGSFFKNPVVRSEVADRLLDEFPEMPVYFDGEYTKIAAGWLIDRLGFRGRQVGGFAVNDRQALVITNDGTGTADDLRELVALILSSVKATYGLSLAVEPTQLGQLN
ncbi:MAG: UDP-N-acetylenolpyruvoylglucosamine reductase [Gammaproteobacteria bacterium]|nr:UDP-N-acetylenolpyruvoylglucosamine reductase [Gammaproteobacteria bacterium]